MLGRRLSQHGSNCVSPNITTAASKGLTVLMATAATVTDNHLGMPQEHLQVAHVEMQAAKNLRLQCTDNLSLAVH